MNPLLRQILKPLIRRFPWQESIQEINRYIERETGGRFTRLHDLANRGEPEERDRILRAILAALEDETLELLNDEKS